MVLGGYRYGLFPDEDHAMGGGRGVGRGTENAERGRMSSARNIGSVGSR